MTGEQIVASLLADPSSYPEADPAPEQPTDILEVTDHGVEIRVGLATVLGLDQRPGEVPGWGPVLPALARRIVARQAGAEWRFAITDPDGHLLLAGLTRRRPTTMTGGTEGGIVELHIPAALLTELALNAERAGPWATVIADLARQYADRPQLLRDLDAHPGRRYPHAALRRHIQVRDRTCVAPGCRRAAARSDVDHTLDHVLGGPTTSHNTGPLCPRHHAMKHLAGWQLTQPEPGLFRWTSPMGGEYRTRGEPIHPPLPEPVARGPDETPEDPAPGRPHQGPIFNQTRPPERAEPQPPPPRNEPNGPPPF